MVAAGGVSGFSTDGFQLAGPAATTTRCHRRCRRLQQRMLWRRRTGRSKAGSGPAVAGRLRIATPPAVQETSPRGGTGARQRVPPSRRPAHVLRGEMLLAALRVWYRGDEPRLRLARVDVPRAPRGLVGLRGVELCRWASSYCSIRYTAAAWAAPCSDGMVLRPARRGRRCLLPLSPLSAPWPSQAEAFQPRKWRRFNVRKRFPNLYPGLMDRAELQFGFESPKNVAESPKNAKATKSQHGAEAVFIISLYSVNKFIQC